MTDPSQSEEVVAQVPVEWVALRGGRLGIHKEGHTEIRTATEVVLSLGERDKAIATDQALTHAWLMQVAERRNATDDPLPALLRTSTLDALCATISEREPGAFAGAPPRPNVETPTVPNRPVRPALKRFSSDGFAKLTGDRLAHRAWLDTWNKASASTRSEAEAIAAFDDFIRNKVLKMAGGPPRVIAKTVVDVCKAAAGTNKFGQGRTRCVWTPGALTAQLFHVTTANPAIWTVTKSNDLPVGLQKRVVEVPQALASLRQLHATALYLAARVTFAALPHYTTLEWQSTHQVRTFGVQPAPVPILAATLDYRRFQAENASLLGTLEGGALPQQSWLQWHEDDKPPERESKPDVSVPGQQPDRT